MSCLKNLISYVDLCKTFVSRVSTGKTRASCDFVLNPFWARKAIYNTNNDKRIKAGRSRLFAGERTTGLLDFLLIKSPQYARWTKLSEYSVSLVHTCILVQTWSVCILSMLALTVFCLGSVFCLTSAMLICSMFALYSIIAKRVLFFVF